MPRGPISITITRAGTILPGAPQVRRYIGSVWTGNGREIAPNATMETSRTTISFLDRTYDARVGDLATFPEGSYGRIVNVRKYDLSLQCDIQVIPYVYVRLWTPTAMSGRVTVDKDVKDVGYTNGGLILAYLDPLRDDVKMTMFGSLDAPIRYAYTLQVIPIKAILVMTDGSGWIATTTSYTWEPAGDIRCLCQSLEHLPAGVTA